MADDDLAPLLGLLWRAAECWSRRQPFDEAATEAIRHEAIRSIHGRYVRCLPVYARLAEERGLGGEQSVGLIADELMVTSDVFKSYAPRWLEDSDFTAMTDLLDDRFTGTLNLDVTDVTDVQAWRRRLARNDVFLTLSSGTNGRLSFVPRDRFTHRASITQGRVTIPPLWDKGDGDMDCLVLGPPGRGKGMEVAARAVASAAARSHVLLDADRDSEPDDAAYDAALDFLQCSVQKRRPVLVFGTQAYVAELCRRVAASGRVLRLREGSVVLTGGGKGQHVPAGAAFHECVTDPLGIASGRVVDAYSAAELNCVLMTCGFGRYHVPPTVEPVILDDALMRIDADEAIGTLGFLDPFALSYPGFVVLGDLARLTREPCPCGLRGPAIVGEITRAAGFEARGCAGVPAQTLG